MTQSLAAGPYPLWTVIEDANMPLGLPYAIEAVVGPQGAPAIFIFTNKAAASMFAGVWKIPPHSPVEIPSRDDLRKLLEFSDPMTRQIAVDPKDRTEIKNGTCRYDSLAQVLADLAQP